MKKRKCIIESDTHPFVILFNCIFCFYLQRACSGLLRFSSYLEWKSRSFSDISMTVQLLFAGILNVPGAIVTQLRTSILYAFTSISMKISREARFLFLLGTEHGMTLDVCRLRHRKSYRKFRMILNASSTHHSMTEAKIRSEQKRILGELVQLGVAVYGSNCE